jgi:hypothetical protein
MANNWGMRDSTPDVAADDEFAVDMRVETIFADPHFVLQLHEEDTQAFRHSYRQYLQGYMALTPDGIKLARHFFLKIAAAFRKENYIPSALFASSVAWVKPHPDQSLSHWSFPPEYENASQVWSSSPSLPPFRCVYHFRFLTSRSSCQGGHTDDAFFFRNVNDLRLRTSRRYTAFLRHNPDYFVQYLPPPPPPYYDPILDEEDLELLRSL